MTVKSHLVWNAKIVSPKLTAPVIPTAIITKSGSYTTDMQPRRKDSARVKMARKMKFIGELRRTDSQQAIAIIVTSVTPNAIQNSS